MKRRPHISVSLKQRKYLIFALAVLIAVSPSFMIENQPTAEEIEETHKEWVIYKTESVSIDRNGRKTPFPVLRFRIGVKDQSVPFKRSKLYICFCCRRTYG